MTKARRELISVEDTPFYHCISRCVRRAWLCGNDPLTGVNYDHRKQWIVSRLRFLSYVYAIDIAAYAVLSNHYHVILHVDQARADGWTMKEVAERWMQLFKGNLLVDRWLREEALSPAQFDLVSETIETWRERLASVSWFMRCVNETIAGMANKEDDCKGRFWEGRFKSQALLDEAALLTCMTYVDLNPVRAGIAQTLEDSDFTSVQQRLHTLAQEKQSQTEACQQLAERMEKQEAVKQEIKVDHWPQADLMPFDGRVHTSIHLALPFTREDYLELVESTGKVVREDKGGAIPDSVIPVLQRFGIDAGLWTEQIQCYGQHFSHCAGRAARMKTYAERFERC